MLRFTLPLFLLLSALVGCDQPGAPPAAPLAQEKAVKDVVRDDLARWLEFAAREQVESASLERELARPLQDLEALGLRHPTVMRTLYRVRKHRPAWVDLTGAQSSGLSERGSALRSSLGDGETKHGLYRSDLHLDEIEALQAGTGRSASGFDDVRFEAAELRLVDEWAKAHPKASAEELARSLADRAGPTPRLAELVEGRVQTLQTATRSKVRLDLYLTDALIEYGMQMRWSNPAWSRDLQWPDHLQVPEEETRLGRVDRQRGRRDLLASRELLPVFEETEQLPAKLAELAPPFDQYSRLTGAFAEYSRIVADGGWPQLPPGAGELKVGSDDPAVAVLKKRLRAEGYWEGDESTSFSESLAEALREYQRTHQLWEKGVLSRETRASLDVPAERRLAQIRVALQRWRESEIGAANHYVFVNIPDFHAEVWKNDERKMRIRTVVGATTHERDPDTGAFQYVHATPELSSQIQHVVFNPYWWVPQNIARNEIEPEIAKNPWYLKENGYEYAEDDRGQAVVRQKPGPNNALGRVKINFDNPYQIYMHDTPEKTLFKWPARAFSHGCIRLQQPMEFARYLLEQDGQWDDAQIQTIQDAGEEKWLTLATPVPVHIEYYVVRVDDRGRANFLSDLYARDVSRMQAAMKREAEPTLPVSTVD